MYKSSKNETDLLIYVSNFFGWAPWVLIFTNASLFVSLCLSVFIAVGEQDVIVLTVVL